MIVAYENCSVCRARDESMTTNAAFGTLARAAYSCNYSTTAGTGCANGRYQNRPFDISALERSVDDCDINSFASGVATKGNIGRLNIWFYELKENPVRKMFAESLLKAGDEECPYARKLTESDTGVESPAQFC